MSFDLDVLKIDAAAEARRVAEFVVGETKKVFRRSGAVVGLSGGVDSAVVAAIAVAALGKDRVVGLILPEKESNPNSARYAAAHAAELGIEHHLIDLTAAVDAVGGYAWRDDYLKTVVPELQPDWTYNITLPTDLLERDAFNFYVLQARAPDGRTVRQRLNQDAFRALAAFATIKIRLRMVRLYWEAERRGFVVLGTTNRTEFVLGDFAKYGDGGTDLEPVAHLYKNQIYQLANHFCVLPEIIDRAPSPDTFSLPVTDQEFFFRIPFDRLDPLLWAWEHDVPMDVVARTLGLPEDSVQRVFRDFLNKNRATAHLRESPRTVEPIGTPRR